MGGKARGCVHSILVTEGQQEVCRLDRPRTRSGSLAGPDRVGEPGKAGSPQGPGGARLAGTGAPLRHPPAPPPRPEETRVAVRPLQTRSNVNDS